MGYDDLASLMSKAPEIAIFRRFSALNARNLLYFQAELTLLEKRLEIKLRKCAENQISASDSDPKRLPNLYDRDLDVLKEAGNVGHGQTVWELFEEIRCKLKDYNEALNSQVIASSFQAPHKHDLKFLQDMLGRSMENATDLVGLDAEIWESGNDLMALKARPKLDFFSNIFIDGDLQDKALKFWATAKSKFKKQNGTLPTTSNSHDGLKDQYINFEDQKMYDTINKVTTVIACMLPITGVIILYFVHNMGARLGIVAAFMAIFALTLAFATDASRVDIFTATSGFAAILVIFVGSTSFQLN